MILLPPAIAGNAADPHWYWWIIAYLFLGGIAAGAFLIAAVVDLFTPAENRPVARLGYLIAMPLTALCGLLLTVDLGKPLRFWHMLINVTTWQPAFKYWSPMSYGSWVLTAFGLASGLMFVLTLAELRGSGLARGPVGKVIAALGAVAALLFVSYTGVLLNTTNQRVWSDNTILGALFAVSGISTGLAAIVLLLALVAILAAAGTAGALVGGLLGLFFWAGVLVVGLLIPLALYLRPRTLGALTPVLAASFALVGGFILRAVILFSARA